MAPTETFELINPMHFGSRGDGRETTTVVKQLTIHRHKTGEGESNLALVTNCARLLRHLDGTPTAVEELIGFQVERALREMAAAAFTRVGIV